MSNQSKKNHQHIIKWPQLSTYKALWWYGVVKRLCYRDTTGAFEQLRQPAFIWKVICVLLFFNDVKGILCGTFAIWALPYVCVTSENTIRGGGVRPTTAHSGESIWQANRVVDVCVCWEVNPHNKEFTRILREIKKFFEIFEEKMKFQKLLYWNWSKSFAHSVKSGLVL